MATERREVVDRRSMLDPHLETVIELRRRGLPWARVAEELRSMGVAATTQNVWKWFRRRQRRATRVARELRPFDQLSKGTSLDSETLGSIENPANTADQAAVAVERLAAQRPTDEFKPAPVKRPPSSQPSSAKGPPQPVEFSLGDDILK